MREKIERLRALQDILAAVQPLMEEERALRREIAEAVLSAELPEGTHHVEVDGVPLTIKVPYTRRVDAAAADVVSRALIEVGFDAGEIFEYVPKIRLKAYRKLPEKYQHLVDSALIVKPGQPVVTFEEDDG